MNRPPENIFFSGKSTTCIKHINPNGGGDTPEAVYEALYASMRYYPCNPEAKKKIILVGDAEPHSTPSGTENIFKTKIESPSKKLKINFDCIIIMNESFSDAYADRSYASEKYKILERSSAIEEIEKSVDEMK